MNRGNNMLVEKKRFNAKSGFTDSEDEDESTRSTSKSPGRSQPLSGRSSLLSARNLDSARSPRDNMQKRSQMQSGNNFQRRRSPENRPFGESDDEKSTNTLSSPRKPSGNARFLDNLSPKSPRVDPRMSDRSEQGGSSLPRFNRQQSNRSNALMRENSYNNNDEERVTPRSSRSNSERDESNNINMLATMRNPLNQNNDLSKTMKRDNFERNPHSNNTAQKQSFSNMSQQRRNLSGGRFGEDDINEEGSLSRSRSGGGRSVENFNDNNNQNFRNQNSMSPGRNDMISPRANQLGRFPRAESFEYNNKNNNNKNDFNADRNEKFDSRNDRFDKNKNISGNQDQFDNNENERFVSRRESNGKDSSPPRDSLSIKSNDKIGRSENPEKDLEVIETLEDSRNSSKLQQQREEKRIEREKRAKNQTESTKSIENAIEMVENTMEDSMRLANLKEKSIDLKYPSKPKLDETKVMLDNSRPRQLNRSLSARGPRKDRSSSASSIRPFRDKYSHVKAKTMTRLPAQTARTDDDENNRLNSSKTDFMNDSSSLRENIYNEWYQKKLQDAKYSLKYAQVKQRDDEELKAQDLIGKLEKSQVEYKKWMMAKEDHIQKQKLKQLEIKRTEFEKKQSDREQKLTATKAFDQWVINKKEKIREDKENKQDTMKIIEKEKRTLKKTEKPPLPYEAWNKKKEDQKNEKFNSEKEKSRQQKQKEKEKFERKRLAEISYLEWLDKKEEEDDNKTNLNRSLSNSMSAMPPFYPNSRTIPFGR